MNWDTFVNYFSNTGIALYEEGDNEYLHQMHQLKADKRDYQFLVKNPTSQFLYITVETYSERMFPRAAKCMPKTQVALYLDHDDWNTPVERSYEWIGGLGFGTLGKLKDELEPGNYGLTIINQGWETGAVDLTIHIYATRQMAELIKY